MVYNSMLWIALFLLWVADFTIILLQSGCCFLSGLCIQCHMGYQKWLCSWWDTESYAACCCTGDTQLGSVCYTSIKYAQFSLQICCILKTIFDKVAVPVCKFFFLQHYHFQQHGCQYYAKNMHTWCFTVCWIFAILWHDILLEVLMHVENLSVSLLLFRATVLLRSTLLKNNR